MGRGGTFGVRISNCVASLFRCRESWSGGRMVKAGLCSFKGVELTRETPRSLSASFSLALISAFSRSDLTDRVAKKPSAG